MNEIRTSIQHRWHRNITDVLIHRRARREGVSADAVLVLSALPPERAPTFAPAMVFWTLEASSQGDATKEKAAPTIVGGRRRSRATSSSTTRRGGNNGNDLESNDFDTTIVI